MLMDFLACLRKWTHENATVAQMDFLACLRIKINRNAVITQVKRAKQNAKPLILTIPILNAGLGLNAKFCVYL